MAIPEGIPPVPLTVESFVDFYTDADAQIGPITASLSGVLEAEAMFCPADPAERTDPATRISFMAGCLAAASSLHPDHLHLIPKPKAS